jgi:hypothetical protein
MVFLEKLLHVDRGDFQLAFLSRGSPAKGGSEDEGGDSANDSH